MPPAIQIDVPGTRRTNQPDVGYYPDDPPQSDIEWFDDIRITPKRIISDLLGDGYGDLEHLASIAVDAVYDGKLTGHELAQACEPHASRYSWPDGATLAGFMWHIYTGTELPMTNSGVDPLVSCCTSNRAPARHQA